MLKFLFLFFFFAFVFSEVVKHPKMPGVLVKEVSSAEQKAALNFWTPERMSSAKPIEELLPSSYFEKFGLPSVNQKLQDPVDGKFEPETDFVRPESLYQVYPYKTMGRAFFLFQNRTAACTGSSVGNNVVLTAGFEFFFSI